MILHLSPTCLPLLSPLWVLWAAWFYTCLPHLSPTLGAMGRVILHLSAAGFPFWVHSAAWFYICLPPDFTLVSHLSPTCPPRLSSTRCSWPPDFLASHLSPTLVSHSGCFGPHAFTFVSHLSSTLVSGFVVLWAACFNTCLPLVSRSGWPGPHDFTFVSRLSSTLPALGALGRVILHVSPTFLPRRLPLWTLWAAWLYTCLPLWVVWAVVLHLSPICFHAWRKICCY